MNELEYMKLAQATEQVRRWQERFNAAVEDAQVQRDRVYELEQLLNEAQDALMSVDPEFSSLTAENRKLREKLEKYENLEVREFAHYCMPYCPEECDIKTVRTYHLEEVIERRDPSAFPLPAVSWIIDDSTTE